MIFCRVFGHGVGYNYRVPFKGGEIAMGIRAFSEEGTMSCIPGSLN